MTEAPIFNNPLLYRRLLKKESYELKNCNWKYTLYNFPYIDNSNKIIVPFINIRKLKINHLPKVDLFTNYGTIHIVFPINYPFSTPVINFSRFWKLSNKISYKFAIQYLDKLLPKDVTFIIKKYINTVIIEDFKNSMFALFNNSLSRWYYNYSHFFYNWSPSASLNNIFST